MRVCMMCQGMLVPRVFGLICCPHGCQEVAAVLMVPLPLLSLLSQRPAAVNGSLCNLQGIWQLCHFESWCTVAPYPPACPHRSVRCAARSDKDLSRYIQNAVEVDPERPVLVDKYLDRADELDVDALCDKDGNVVICGIMQHIEQAGVHSGAPPPPCFLRSLIDFFLWIRVGGEGLQGLGGVGFRTIVSGCGLPNAPSGSC